MRSTVKGGVAETLAEDDFRTSVFVKTLEREHISAGSRQEETQAAEVRLNTRTKRARIVGTHVGILAPEHDRMTGKICHHSEHVAARGLQLQHNQLVVKSAIGVPAEDRPTICGTLTSVDRNTWNVDGTRSQSDGDEISRRQARHADKLVGEALDIEPLLLEDCAHCPTELA